MNGPIMAFVNGPIMTFVKGPVMTFVNAAVLLVLAAFVTPLAAQDQPAPRVSLGFAAAPPGKQVTIPILLEGASGNKVGRVVSEVRFPAALKFVRLERAALLSEDRFEAVAVVRDGATGKGTDTAPGAKPEKEHQILDVRVASRSDDTTLRDGILGYLVFEIDKDTSPEKTPDVVLAFDAKIFAGTSDTATPLATVSDNAKLIVEKPGVPVISCFFYMH